MKNCRAVDQDRMMVMKRAVVSGKVVCGNSVSGNSVSGNSVSDHAVSGKLSAPWWKEPLMWLVLGLPASVVVAGIYTIMLASRSMP